MVESIASSAILQPRRSVSVRKRISTLNEKGMNVLKLPAEVLAAKDRMERADAALRADIESAVPVDKVRRIQLIDELQLAADDYVEKISCMRS